MKERVEQVDEKQSRHDKSDDILDVHHLGFILSYRYPNRRDKSDDILEVHRCLLRDLRLKSDPHFPPSPRNRSHQLT
jgi:hypothetical protein